MATPGSALVGYAILRANYNSQAPNYLDNFAPFVLSAISSAPSAIVERHSIATLVRDAFGVDIPVLVVPRLLRRTTREGLTEPVGTDAVRLTPKGERGLPDLTSALSEYRRKQAELVHEFASFIGTEFPEHEELTTGDLAANLAEFFDRQAVSVLKQSLGREAAPDATKAGIQYVVAAFVAHLAARDQVHFAYVVEAAKGAMLASVLELDTSSMNESLSGLTLVLDTPVAMDALGHHGPIPASAMTHVLDMARQQGARVVIFDHSVSEMDGILEAIEGQLRRGGLSRATSAGYLHYAEIGASPADLAVAREHLPDQLADAGISVVDRPEDYHKYGLDEEKLDEKIHSRVHYLQDAARVNDVRSLSAVHRLRRGERSKALERCRAVMMTSNINLVWGAVDFRDENSFPLAVTAESVASLLWARSPALAPDVPREMVLATAYVGMQPSPTLWAKYVAEIESLEASGRVSADDAVVLRSTRVGRDAFMAESLGEADAVIDELPIAVLERVRGAISDPLLGEVGELESRLAQSDAVANHATEDWLRQVEAREEAEKEAAAKAAESSELKARLHALESSEVEKRKRIRDRARLIARRRVRGVAWVIRSAALLLAAGAVYVLVTSDDLSTRGPTLLVGIIGIASFALPFMPRLDAVLSLIEERLARRGERKRLVDTGFDPAVSTESEIR
ncbi:hypothetical protein [Microbacterium sp. PM5]|uniref:hypothetical protein n=1 Tax=Microbacterium sp. PM5 TaxID=2014534 RepID=UPI000DD11705|nr:hypothetical protein [Microbacterium sp. PM5]AXA96956.1 hypothetical protein CEP17_11345 [Microbacterium sp. PM5]